MDIARVRIASPVEWLRGRVDIVLSIIQRAKPYHSPALPDDSRRQLQRERLSAQLRLDRLGLSVRRPL
jgi:hypothetical protein